MTSFDGSRCEAVGFSQRVRAHFGIARFFTALHRPDLTDRSCEKRKEIYSPIVEVLTERVCNIARQPY
jgi:hypothetical protein